MQGDFSTVRFDATRHFSAVLSQQGRVPLDSDVNEGVAGLLYYLRTAVADILGRCAYPTHAPGFAITLPTDGSKDLDISPGRMYVDGILAENDATTPVTYWNQPDAYLDPDDRADALPDVPYLVYLRVWERLITAVQDPSIREIALGEYGPDTAARAKVVWQVAAAKADLPSSPPPTAQDALDWIDTHLVRADDVRPLLAARVTPNVDDNPCDVSPTSMYRGPENQLYRIEVHSGGPAHVVKGKDGEMQATFKWSRENASVVFPIANLAGNDVTLVARGRDDKLDLHVGDLVEIVDDRYDLRAATDNPLAEPTPTLRRVTAVDYRALLVTLSEDPLGSDGATGTDPTRHPLLRRWDHGAGGVALADDGGLAIAEDTWIDVEDGIQVYFSSAVKRQQQRGYRRGDYWWIPARVVSGSVVWPVDATGPVARPPAGVAYHYAPLAWVIGDTALDLRLPHQPAAHLAPGPPENAAAGEPADGG